MTEQRGLLDIRQIYAKDAAVASARGQEVLECRPNSEVVPVASHWNVPEVHGDQYTHGEHLHTEHDGHCDEH